MFEGAESPGQAAGSRQQAKAASRQQAKAGKGREVGTTFT